jgi:uncharacterized protein
MFVPLSHRCARGRSQRLAGVLASVIAVFFVALSGGLRHRQVDQTRLLYILAGAAVAAAFVFMMRRLMTPERDDASASPAADASHEDRHYSLLIIVAIVAGLLALGLFLALTPRAAASQQAMAAPVAATQSAFVITRGVDTLVVERVTRGRSSITADLNAKAASRIVFTAEVAAGPFVPLLSFKAWGPGAPADAPPIQSGTQTMTADSAFIVVQGAAGERKVTRAITNRPLPLMNNEFTMFELAIERARTQGGSKATVPMFALSAGVQLDVTFEFVGADSCIVRIAGQETRFSIDAHGLIAGGVVPAQNVIISRVDGAAVDKIAIGRPDYGAPAGAPYTAEDVTVKTPMGHVLTGTLTFPKNAKGKAPAVVTITGSGQQDRDEYIPLVPGYRIFRQVADTLGRRGIAVLRLDDRVINGSGGDVMKATSEDFANDIRAGVAFLRARPDIDGARIALVGHSEGGVIAPMVASTDPKLAGIVLMAGTAYTGQRVIDFQLKNSVMGTEQIPAAKKDSALKALVAEFDSTTAKLPWMKFFLTYDPSATAQKVKTPVLIMQGATDQQVTPEQAPLLEQAFKRGGNKDVTLKVFKDRNHLFLQDPSGFPGGYVKLKDGKIDGEVMGTLADWLSAHLKP